MHFPSSLFFKWLTQFGSVPTTVQCLSSPQILKVKIFFSWWLFNFRLRHDKINRFLFSEACPAHLGIQEFTSPCGTIWEAALDSPIVSQQDLLGSLCFFRNVREPLEPWKIEFWFSSTRKNFLKKFPWINQFSVVEGWSRYQFRSAFIPNAQFYGSQVFLISRFWNLKYKLSHLLMSYQERTFWVFIFKEISKSECSQHPKALILFSIMNLNMTCVWHTASKIHHNWEQCNSIGWNFYFLSSLHSMGTSIPWYFDLRAAPGLCKLRGKSWNLLGSFVAQR